MTLDIFREVRERVTAQQAAHFYNYYENGAGYLTCPFHAGGHERTPSLKFYGGGFVCFACGSKGSCVDFVCLLFNLTPLEAVRKLDEDFHLGLELDRPLTAEERREAAQETRRRRELSDTYQAFAVWKRATVQQLNEVFRLAHLTMKRLEAPEDLDVLTDGEAEAIRWQAWAEYMSDTLNGGTTAEQMEIFRERKAVSERCDRILNSTQMKSGVA